MHYVYIIKSLEFPKRIYVGSTEDLVVRLKEHNSGYSFHTAKYRPWELMVYLVFKNKTDAISFEKYLKSGSGRVLVAKRLLGNKG